MSVTVNVNGVAISYPQTGDSEWGDEATDFAIQVGSVLQKIGQGNQTPTTDNIAISPGNLTVTSGNLSVGGNTTLTGNLTANGNTTLGNATSDTIAVTGILNVDSGTLYVNPTDNRVGINDSTPSEALDVTGNALISGTLGVTGNVITSIVKASGSGGLTIDSNGGTDVALFGAGGGSGTTLYGGLNGTTATFSGVIYADDDTTANTPVISFTGDTNTGIGRSAADTIDLITNAVSRAKISSTGQQSSVIPDLSGSNTNLFPEYKCRAWVNFNGTGTIAIRGSGNVTSITDNGTGDYTVNMTIDMPDINYAVVSGLGTDVIVGGVTPSYLKSNFSPTSNTYVAPTVSNFRLGTISNSLDSHHVYVAVFR
jgi:hypothetical protein